MINRLMSILATRKIAAAFGILYLINQGILLWIISGPGIDCLKIQLTFSPQVFSGILSKWNHADLSAYLKHFYFDSYHPLLYAVFLSSIIAVLARRNRSEVNASDKFFFLLPFIAAFLDILENGMHILMIFHRELISPAWVIASGSISNAKWLLVFSSILYIIYMLRRGCRNACSE